MKLASHYNHSGPIHELQESWTNREYLVRRDWLRKQWNEPNRTDYYILRLIWEVHFLLAENRPSELNLEKFRVDQGLEFSWGSLDQKQGRTPQEQLTEEQQIAYQTAMSKLRWSGIIGNAPVKKSELLNGHGT